MMKKLGITLLLAIGFMQMIMAQDDQEGSSAAQANNPLANMTALNFQNYFMPKLSDAPGDAYINTTWIRFAKPVANGRFLLRASAPINTYGVPDGNGTVQTLNGLGDVNVFLSYNFLSKPTATMGIGPLLAMPTATEEAIGSGKWQAGFAFVTFIAKTPAFQFGGLVTWQTSIAGDDDRADTNMAAIQPFYFWQLGKGLCLRGAPIWVFDIENDSYSVPLGLGIGKVVPLGNTVFNLFVEPQYSIFVDGYQPVFQIFTGINLQFNRN